MRLKDTEKGKMMTVARSKEDKRLGKLEERMK